MEEIIVSIWCMTYNHEMYVRDAIEGFLSQKTSFRYEIIIHDDASTDNTVKIIKEYEQKYPDLIHSICQKNNQYSRNQPSTKWIWDIAAQNCKGKYIAICEGDDYWIDVQKLQIQVDFLETHSEYIMAVHDAVNVDYVNHVVKSGSAYDKDCKVSSRDIIMQNKCIFSASMVYRREVLQMNGFFVNSGISDYPILLYSLEKGKIFYFTRIMSVYRQHHEGSWSRSFMNGEIRWPHSILMIEFLMQYNKYTNKKYNIYTVSRIQKSAMDIINMCIGMSKEEFLETSDKNFQKMGRRYGNIFKQLNNLWLHLFEEDYMKEDIVPFCNKFQKIVIMGAGKYAGIMAKKLHSKGITFEGFVISDDQQSEHNYLGKAVWKLSLLPFDLVNTGIIIAINPSIWEEIICSLMQAGAENYICPFLLVN